MTIHEDRDMNDHDKHLTRQQAEQARNLITIIRERLETSAPNSEQTALARAAAAAVEALQRELVR